MSPNIVASCSRRENIPQYGPIIFTSKCFCFALSLLFFTTRSFIPLTHNIASVNHANQFMDAVMVVCSCRRQVSYLMAEASWRRRIVGDIAWALGVVPVKRAQDDARAGTGKIKMQKPTNIAKTDSEEEQSLISVEGASTKFSLELTVGDKIRPQGTAHGLKIISIVSDTKMVVDGMNLPDEFPSTVFGVDAVPAAYDLMKRTPLTTVFEKVLDRLAGGGAVGIFPEGGSHDRTDLLPLKVGISLIAYSALEKDGLIVPVVPVGLSYFRAHRWRGRAVVEYGRPFYVDPSTLHDFKAGGNKRRKVCNDFLEEVETSMRSVILSAPDYETLELIHTARRLYQRKKGQMDTIERQNLSRRFVEGYKRLVLMTDGKPPPEWLELQDRITAYRNELKDLGIKDYQVLALKEEHLGETLDIEKVGGDNILRFLQLPYNIVQKMFLIFMSAIPMLLLNLPVGVLAGLYSEGRRKKALANSKVKIKGFDVRSRILAVMFWTNVSNWLMMVGLFNHTGDADGKGYILHCNGADLVDDIRASARVLHKMGATNDFPGNAIPPNFRLHWHCSCGSGYNGVVRHPSIYYETVSVGSQATS